MSRRINHAVNVLFSLGLLMISTGVPPVRAELILQHYEEDAAFLSIFFLDGENGWVCGTPDKILYTEDGGNSWKESLVPPPNEVLYDISFSSRKTGFCMAWNEHSQPLTLFTLYKTGDGGVTWRRVNVLPDSIVAYSFCNENTGWAGVKSISGDWRLMKTNDGGKTFEPYFIIPSLYEESEGHKITGFSVPDKDSVWFTSTNGDIYSYSPDPITVGETNDKVHSLPLIVYPPTPNPFNSSTIISFHLKKKSYVELNVYNAAGQKVSTLISGITLNEGFHQVKFDGNSMSNGVYCYVCRADNIQKTGKMTVLK